MDGVHHLHQVVLTGWIVQVKVGEVGEVRLHGDPGAPGKIVDAHAGNDGGSRLGFIGVMGDDGVGGVGLRALEEMGQGVRCLQPVFQHLARMTRGDNTWGYLTLMDILSFQTP